MKYFIAQKHLFGILHNFLVFFIIFPPGTLFSQTKTNFSANPASGGDIHFNAAIDHDLSGSKSRSDMDDIFFN